MEQTKIISGNNEAEVWQQVAADLKDELTFEYHVVIKQQGKTILLDIDIDPGGGFESGYEFTKLSSQLQQQHDFRFALHHEDLIGKVGKLLGMEDVIIGYPEFDNSLIVKTNNAEKIKAVFADKATRETFQPLTHFTIHIDHHSVDDKKEKQPFLEFEIQQGITDPAALRKIYHAFVSILTELDK